MFINDMYPRATAPGAVCRPKPTGRWSGRGKKGASIGSGATILAKPASAKTPLWEPAAWSPKTFRPTRSWPAIRQEFCVKLKRRPHSESIAQYSFS